MATNKVILNGEAIIDLTKDTADETVVVEGYTFHKADGSWAVGTRSPYSSEFIPSGTREITTNGRYNVSDVAEALVSVYPELENKEVSVNYGEKTTISHSQGVYGMNSVAVSVNPLTETLKITENIPEAEPINIEKYGKLVVDVNPPLETVDMVYVYPYQAKDITPSAGYYGIKSVRALVNMTGYMEKPSATYPTVTENNKYNIDVTNYAYISFAIPEYDGSVSITEI